MPTANLPNPFPVATASVGYTSSSGTITRPSDTTTYSGSSLLGDVVGVTGGGTAAITFANIGPSGADIVLTSAELRFDLSLIPTGMTSFRLHLYNVTPPSAFADNAVWGYGSGDRASYLGFIDLGSPEDFGTTLFAQVNGIGKHVKLASTDLFGYLVTVGGWIPVSAATHAITLHAAA